MSSYSRIQLENWLKTIEVKGNVIDVGGAQNPVKGRTGKWEAEEYTILDLKNPHETKQEPDFLFDIQDMKVERVNVNDLTVEWTDDPKKATQEIGGYDIAFCLEVSEYWYNPLQALKNINRLLKKGGTLYISFHFVYPVHAPKGKDYLRYTEDGAVKLLEEAGFEIEKTVYRKSMVLCPCHYYRSENMRGLKDYDHKIIGTLIEAKKC